MESGKLKRSVKTLIQLDKQIRDQFNRWSFFMPMNKANKQAVSQQNSPQAQAMDKLVDKYGEQVKRSLNTSDMINSVNSTPKPKGFQKGNTFGLTNRRGKQRLATSFVDDLSYEWSKRGQSALAELTGDKLVQACIAILPKDVLVSMNQSEAVQWVINAQPLLSTDDWLASHNLQPVDNQDNTD